MTKHDQTHFKIDYAIISNVMICMVKLWKINILRISMKKSTLLPQVKA